MSEIRDFGDLVSRYSLGFWAKVSGHVDLQGNVRIEVMARIPDADQPDSPTFRNSSFYGREIVPLHGIIRGWCEEEAHELVRRALKRLWIRGAAHEFEEWLRYEGKRVYDPHSKE